MIFVGKYISSDKVFYHLEELVAWKKDGQVNPVTIEIHPSNACNNSCFYCCMDKVKDQKIMSKEEIAYAINYTKNLRAKGIIFSGGGEPTIAPCFEDALYFAKDLGLDIGVITNGINLTNSKRKTILEKATWVRISLDAMDPETYKKIRGTDFWETVVSNLHKLLEERKYFHRKPTIGLQIVVNKYNYTKIREICRAMNHKFTDIDYIQVRPIEMKVNEDPYSLDELKEIEPQLKQIKANKKVIVSDKWDLFFKNHKREFGYGACHCAEFIGVIDAYSNFYLCCHTVKNQDYKYCNIKEVDSSTFFSRRQDHLRKLGKTKGFNPLVCPLACRGSNINRVLQGLVNENEHKNFL